MLQCAIFAITLLAIYRQLQAQHWATELDLRRAVTAEWDGERMVRATVAAAMHVVQGKPGMNPAMEDIANWMENLAELQRRRLLQPEFTWFQWNVPIQGWWAAIAPRITERRDAEPLLWTEWEKLVVRLAERDRKAGTSYEFSPKAVTRDLNNLIPEWLERLHTEHDIRTGMIPSWPSTDDA